MNKIKRKIVLHGPSTLTISLPSSWVRKFNIKKGDELDLEEYDKELRIGFEKEFGLGKKQVNIENLKRLGKTYLTSSYRQGYDEICLSFNDSKYIKVIQDVISKEMTGFEIIKQGKNHCVVKDLTGHSKDELDNALRRMWLLIIDLSNEGLNALKKKNITELKNIRLMDQSINKFSNYCLRLLIKKGHSDFSKTPLYYHLIKSLEEIADQYKDLCSFYSHNIKKIDSSLVVAFTKINDHLNEFHELFYKYDEQRMEDLFAKTKLTYNKLANLKYDAAYHVSSICGGIRNLLPVLVEIKL